MGGGDAATAKIKDLIQQLGLTKEDMEGGMSVEQQEKLKRLILEEDDEDVSPTIYVKVIHLKN